MGWIAATAFRIGGGKVASPIQVDEAAGFDGERVTPTGQTTSKAYPEPFTIARNGRAIHKTLAAALRDAKGQSV